MYEIRNNLVYREETILFYDVYFLQSMQESKPTPKIHTEIIINFKAYNFIVHETVGINVKDQPNRRM